MSKPEFVYTTYIKTTPEKLWEALTNPEFTRQYWANIENVSDWKKGSKWDHIARDDSDPVWVTGQILEVDRPKRLVFSWIDPDNQKDQSRVTYEIEKIEDMTRLTVTHDNFTPESAMPPKISQGWPKVLASLKSFLETGKGMELFGQRKNASR